MSGLAETWLLTVRALKASLRQPANEVANAFIPLFFYVVTIGAVGEVAKNAFGVDDYKGFQVPVAVLQGAAGVASGAGLAMTIDIQSGYFEKLLLTTAPRFAVVFARMLADSIKAMILTALIIAVAMLVGAGFETGPLGVVFLVFLGGTFALAYSGIGMAIAVKTGSPQAAQAGFILFFPLIFLAPTFAPLSVFAGWLEVIARINPVTYILLGMRSLVTDGWDGLALLKMAASIGGMAVVTFSLVGLAMRSRNA